MIKAVIFDCFGVLWLHHHRMLTEYFEDSDKKNEFDDLFNQFNYGYISRVEYIENSAQLIGKTTKQIEEMIETEHTINHLLLEYIEKELKPKYKIGMLSNIGRGWIQNFFDEHQLHDVFNVVVLSGDEGVTKPHPQIYELVSERLKVEIGECVFIDDLPENIAGADAAGMQGIVYGNLRQMKHELGEVLSA